MTVGQASALADWVASKQRNLTTIYITHGHGDHWFGVGTLLDRFPNASVVATPSTVEAMRQNASPEAIATAWGAAFPGQIPAARFAIQHHLASSRTRKPPLPASGAQTNATVSALD